MEKECNHPTHGYVICMLPCNVKAFGLDCKVSLLFCCSAPKLQCDRILKCSLVPGADTGCISFYQIWVETNSQLPITILMDTEEESGPLTLTVCAVGVVMLQKCHTHGDKLGANTKPCKPQLSSIYVDRVLCISAPVTRMSLENGTHLVPFGCQEKRRRLLWAIPHELRTLVRGWSAHWGGDRIYIIYL